MKRESSMWNRKPAGGTKSAPPEKSVDQIINEHVGFSMAVGAIPLPVLDFTAVTAIQIDLIRQLAKKHEVDF